MILAKTLPNSSGCHHFALSYSIQLTQAVSILPRQRQTLDILTLQCLAGLNRLCFIGEAHDAGPEVGLAIRFDGLDGGS